MGTRDDVKKGKNDTALGRRFQPKKMNKGVDSMRLGSQKLVKVTQSGTMRQCAMHCRNPPALFITYFGVNVVTTLSIISWTPESKDLAYAY